MESSLVRAVFLGSGEVALPALRALREAPGVELVGVVTQPDRPVGRHQSALTPPPVKRLVEGWSVPILQPERLRHPDALAALASLAAGVDLFVVMSYGQILPPAVLVLPRIACINLHASLLPRHRGASPIQAALLAGDAASGITVMYMNEGLDTGDLLLARAIPIRRRETVGSLHDRLAELAAPALLAALELLARAEAPRMPQDASLATHSRKLGREDGRIDWSLDHRQVERRIRAMTPWPGASTALPDRRRLKVLRALPSRRLHGSPGEILGTDSDGLRVACGSGGVRLLEVQPEGGRRMSALEFANGHRLEAGHCVLR